MPFLTLRRFRLRKKAEPKEAVPEPEPEADPLTFSVLNLVAKPKPKVPSFKAVEGVEERPERGEKSGGIRILVKYNFLGYFSLTEDLTI